MNLKKKKKPSNIKKKKNQGSDIFTFDPYYLPEKFIARQSIDK